MPYEGRGRAHVAQFRGSPPSLLAEFGATSTSRRADSSSGSIPEGGLSSIDAAIAAIRAGQMIIVIDSQDREGEGDLVMAAQHATAENLNFMATHGRGLICVPMLPGRLASLQIPLMTTRNTDPRRTAFHVGVDCAVGATTGISATDRALAVRALSSSTSVAGDFTQPGHVFPLGYCAGGVLRRPGHTEASVDLAVLAGCEPAACICEIAGADGEMARLPELLELGRAYRLPVVTIADLIEYRRGERGLVRRGPSARLPLAMGEFTAVGYQEIDDGREHFALVFGSVSERAEVLVHVHAECVAGDVFRSQACRCAEQLSAALDRIAAEGCGVLVYLRSGTGRLFGGPEDSRPPTSRYLRTVEEPPAFHPDRVDEGDRGVANQILRDLGVSSIRLIAGGSVLGAVLDADDSSHSADIPLRASPRTSQLRVELG